MVSGALRGLGAFRKVINGGHRWDAGFLRSYVRLERGVPSAFHIGISISARAYTAVQRNRLRRLVREGIRRERPAVSAALQLASARADMVIQVRAGVGHAALKDVHPPVALLCKKLVRLAAETP